MHVLRIWPIWYVDDYRRTRHRENLRVPLVLVHFVGDIFRCDIDLPFSYHLGIPNTDISVENPSPCTWVEFVASNYLIGDWFILFFLSNNINPIVFNEIISNLAILFEGKESLTSPLTML